MSKSYVDLRRLNYLKLVEIVDMLEAVDIKKALHKTQRRIIDELEKEGGFTSQKQLLSKMGVSELTLISNIKKLEEAGIVFTKRSSIKFIYLNPAIYYLRSLSKLTREHIFANKKLYDKIAELEKS